MNRRDLLQIMTAAAVAGMPFGANADGIPVAQVGKGAPFSVDALKARAAKMAKRAYTPRATVPDDWLNISYDDYQHFWFRNASALWNDTERPLRVDFFKPGLYFPRPVGVFVVDGEEAAPVMFDLDLFDKTDKAPDLTIDDTLGYSGLRLRTEMGEAGIFREFAVFQGASYFRAIGKDNIYGLSARGIAIDTAEPSGEEFPDFTEFYLEAPEPGATVSRIYAVLDGPSVTGVYTFDIENGDVTVMDVEATIYPRKAISHVGIAPLTSMFLFDETNRNRFDDFRPAVHDSEGLSVLNGAGELLWRPLANPTRLQVSSFVDENPKGFGLTQRSRDFSAYSDLEALYHRRPSLWIEPTGDWGPGAVTLVEIPADREIYDNIVAYWRPREEIPAGQETTYTYRMNWGIDLAERKSVAPVLNTQIGTRFEGGRIVAVNFAPHPSMPADHSELTWILRSNGGKISDGIMQTNPETGGPRLAFTFDAEDRNAVEMRAQLLHNGNTVSEVWLYRWTL